MASAFQVYNKKKKNLKLSLSGLDNEELSGPKASTPLVQTNGIFPSSATEAPPVDNLFLSPIVNKKKKKKSHTNLSVIDQSTSINGEPVPKKKKKKEHNKSECVLTPDQSFKKKTVDSLKKQRQKSEKYSEDLSAFKEDPYKFKRKRESPKSVSKKGPKINGNETPNPPKKKKKESAISSIEEGYNMLAFILAPVTVEDFFENYWEKKPLYISRKDEDYFGNICSIADMEEAFKTCRMYFQKNVTITSYNGEERVTDGTPGRARPNAVWDLLTSGNSIRILNPQTFIPNIGTIVSTLQEYFKNMVGVNSYLTPAGTQGFAPHYDDIEAFVLQLEGEKDWKVYPPRSTEETLPRLSSRDFSQEEIGEPMMEMTLQAGDLLYFPRGFIHQAKSVPEHHSLHITVSTYQCNSWSDFFKTVLPLALEKATANELELRQGIPLNLLDNLGFGKDARSSGSEDRAAILQTASRLFSKILKHCPWDDAADELGKEFIHSSYPPEKGELNKAEWDKLFGENSPGDISLKLITANSCRVGAGVEDSLAVYYSTDNSLSPKEEELFGFEVSPDQAKMVEVLKSNYPKFTLASELGDDDEAVSELLFNLASRGLLNFKWPKTDF